MRKETACLVALALAGCVGDLESYKPPATDRADAGPQEPASPGEMFAATVQPALQRCAGGACHTGAGTTPLKFLGADDPADDYATITQFPSVTGAFEPTLATLLTKIEPGPHNGMTYSPAERAAIVDWLQEEKVVRLADGDEPGDGDPAPAASALAAWSGCMTKANWDATGMGAWSDKQTEDGDGCATCHDDGAYRFNTNDDNDQMFQLNRYPLYIIGFFTVAVDPDGTEHVVPAHDKLVRMGNGSTLHPRFGMAEGDPYFGYLDDFHAATAAIQAAGQCGPPVTP